MPSLLPTSFRIVSVVAAGLAGVLTYSIASSGLGFALVILLSFVVVLVLGLSAAGLFLWALPDDEEGEEGADQP